MPRISKDIIPSNSGHAYADDNLKHYRISQQKASGLLLARKSGGHDEVHCPACQPNTGCSFLHLRQIKAGAGPASGVGCAHLISKAVSTSCSTPKHKLHVSSCFLEPHSRSTSLPTFHVQDRSHVGNICRDVSNGHGRCKGPGVECLGSSRKSTP